jgi:hypothetical protein
MRFRRSILAATVLALAVGPAAAHVVAAVDDNNRYLKLTPLGDRVRIAYTVFYGDNPGRLERAAIDTDHDAAISETEAHAFGVKLAADVAAALALDVDAVTTPITWAEVDVGMGTPAVAAGAFSIDLVAYACLSPTRGSHRARLHDRFAIAHAGELEIRVEDSPDVTVDRARIGSLDAPDNDFKFVGAGGPPADDGLELAFTAGPQSVVANDGVCDAGDARRGSIAGMTIILAGVVGGAVLGGLAAAYYLIRRRRAAR